MRSAGILLALLLGGLSCLKPKLSELEFFTVSTDSLRVLTLTQVLLTGHIDGLTGQQAEVCGFIWSTDEAAVSGASPAGQVILVPPPNGNANFDTVFTLPAAGQAYFFRAFAWLGERHMYADVIRSFFPGNVVQQQAVLDVRNDTVEVQGLLLGLRAAHLSVDSFGHILSRTSPVPELDQCSGCLVSVFPDGNDDGPFKSSFSGLDFNTTYYARAYARSGDQVFYSKETDTVQVRDGWKPIQNFRKYQQGLAVGADSAGRAYVGFGCEVDGNCTLDNLSPDIWELDPATGNWATVAMPFPSLLKRTNASAFVLGDTIHYAFGEYTNDMGTFPVRGAWKYAIGSGQWVEDTTLRSNCPARSRAIAFELGGKGYMGTGIDVNGGALNDFWEYDPTLGSWRQVASLPVRTDSGPDQDIGRYEAAAFAFDDVAYVGGGVVGGTFLTDFWRFTPPDAIYPDGRWEWVNFFDKGQPRTEAVSFRLGKKGYYGLGATFTNEWLSDFYEFNPADNSWRKRTPFPGGNRRDALGFGLRGFGYAGTGFQRIVNITISQDFRTDMWRYEPEHD